MHFYSSKANEKEAIDDKNWLNKHESFVSYLLILCLLLLLTILFNNKIIY